MSTAVFWFREPPLIASLPRPPLKTPSKPWRWALPVTALLTVLPLFFTDYLPFSDLPEHLAVIATLLHWWDPAWRSQEYFTLQGPASTPYLLYHLVAALLGALLGTAERANLLLLTLAGIGFPYALRALLRSLGRDQRLAVFACCLFFGRALAEGLVTYVVSIPLVLFALALVVRQGHAPRRSRSFWLAFLALAIFYLHLSSFLVLVLGSLLIVLSMRIGGNGNNSTPRPTWRALFFSQLAWLLPAIPPAAVLLSYSAMANPDPSMGNHAGVIRFIPMAFKGHELWPWMHDFWRGPLDDLLAAVAWGALIVLTIFSSPRALTPRPFRYAGPLLMLLALALYFFLPSQIGFAFILDLRLAPFIGLFAALIPRPRAGRLTDGLFILLTCAVVASGLNTCYRMRQYDQEEAKHFDHVIRNLPRGKKLLTLVFHTPSTQVHVSPFIHFGAYYRARFGGIASFSFSEIPYWPLQYRSEVSPPKKSIVFWDWNPCLFRNSVDGPYYDFILMRGDIRPFRSDTPGPRWRVIGAARDWVLYARNPEKLVPSPLPADRTDPGPCAARAKPLRGSRR